MKTYKVLGLMSGTSLDGLDMAYCHIQSDQNNWRFDIKEGSSISYESEMRKELKNSIFLPADALLKLHNSYGEWLGEQVNGFLQGKDLEVDFIASHGHTTHHQPENGLTFQIGNGQHLANSTGIKTICDFRSNDVALGGEGAPLVPIGDELFFGHYDFCLNLGGISNVSFKHQGSRIAYDIGLANMILNHITAKTGLAYDKGGERASKGSINETLLSQLNALEYYKLPFPKSTGYEWFTEKVVPLVDACDDSLENLLHTAIHHICEQVALQVKQHTSKATNTLFVTGGGALNTFMMNLLQRKLGSTVSLVIPNKQLIEYKEALVFSLMGVLRLENKVNVLSSVTGARKDSSSGVIYLPS
ncbi:anhydro-N-acetylmuramic acid kinase [Poritiphilus flavus]|uniref:Anhydro-N-acetylmuramic acid kinase n=1 Tax=Poritiphilus flavus TaxID=2697053 RepID=A0A6L9E9S5_9FLAO|nr:anhydro-N-acetylmuramic acid kinase [Poritiphilus flavus]NAS11414.1 anhydro-N-acetylmuramic acid kinase [Poritiphilus flavus]